jgi:hypothetical protein
MDNSTKAQRRADKQRNRALLDQVMLGVLVPARVYVGLLVNLLDQLQTSNLPFFAPRTHLSVMNPQALATRHA